MATKAGDILKSMNLGVSRNTLAGVAGSPLHTLLIGLNQEILDRLTQSIEKYDASASNRLKQSLLTIDETGENKVSVAISAEFYWKYVEYGTGPQHVAPAKGLPSTWGQKPAGTPSFKESILGWIRDRGLKARPDQTYDHMAFAIMHGIKTKGTKPKPFFSDVVNEELKRYLSKSISEVLKKAIEIEIKEPWQ